MRLRFVAVDAWGRLALGYPTGQVDVAQLTTMASVVERAGKAFFAPGEPLVPAATLCGWTSGAALARAGRAWTAFLTKLVTDVDGFAADLATAAQAYQSTDADAADAIAAAGGRLYAR